MTISFVGEKRTTATAGPSTSLRMTDVLTTTNTKRAKRCERKKDRKPAKASGPHRVEVQVKVLLGGEIDRRGRRYRCRRAPARTVRERRQVRRWNRRSRGLRWLR